MVWWWLQQNDLVNHSFDLTFQISRKADLILLFGWLTLLIIDHANMGARGGKKELRFFSAYARIHLQVRPLLVNRVIKFKCHLLWLLWVYSLRADTWVETKGWSWLMQAWTIPVHEYFSFIFEPNHWSTKILSKWSHGHRLLPSNVRKLLKSFFSAVLFYVERWNVKILHTIHAILTLLSSDGKDSLVINIDQTVRLSLLVHTKGQLWNRVWLSCIIMLESYAGIASVASSGDQTINLFSDFEIDWGAVCGQESSLAVCENCGRAPILRNIVSAFAQTFVIPWYCLNQPQSFCVFLTDIIQVYSIRFRSVHCKECDELLWLCHKSLPLWVRLKFFIQITVERIRLNQLSNSSLSWWVLLRFATTRYLLLEWGWKV